jgi:hypothetical protein
MNATTEMLNRLVALETQMAELKVENEMLKTAMPATSKKSPKTKRATTNTEGPKDWNSFVNSVQHEMAASAGVDVDGLSEKEFKEAAKKMGAGWQEALKEAAIRKRMTEKGEERSVVEIALKEEKAAAKMKKADKKEKKPSTPKKATKSKKSVETSLEKEMAELGMSIREVEGVSYIIDDESGETFTINEDGSFGDRVGIYDAEIGTIDTTA